MNKATERTITLEFEGWQLTPEGAAIYPAERTAVIADLHLGYEWARGASGDCVPAHSLEEALGRLACLLDRAHLAKLVIAGDLVESPRPCPATAQDMTRLQTWLEQRGVTVVILEGNHDRVRLSSGLPPTRTSTVLPIACKVSSWTVGHGDRRVDGKQTISGHHHPVIRFQGATAPCFLVAPGRIVLPSFSSNTAGCDVVTARLPEAWRALPLRCIVSTGSELLDFGSLRALRRRRPLWS
jgi:putative SbcD/Mre11-related phosphoesterase